MFAIEIWPKFRYKIVEAYFGVKKKVWKTIKGHKTLSTPASTTMFGLPLQFTHLATLGRELKRQAKHCCVRLSNDQQTPSIFT